MSWLERDNCRVSWTPDVFIQVLRLKESGVMVKRTAGNKLRIQKTPLIAG